MYHMNKFGAVTFVQTAKYETSVKRICQVASVI
jgi:hypothetical protein